MSSSEDAIWSTVAMHIRHLLSGAKHGRSGSFPQMCFAFSGESVANLNYSALWGAASDEDVDQLMEHLGDLDAMVVVSEASTDRLGPKLKEAGLLFGGACPLMTVELTATAPDEGPYRIEAVRDPEQLATMVNTLADAYALAPEYTSAAFGLAIMAEPDTTPSLAWREGEAHSAAITTRVGTDIGIWAMGTAARFQRQGAGRALLGTVMSRLATEGAKRCFLFPSPAGRRLYDSLGFVEVDRSEIWLKGISTEFPE